MTSDTTIDKQTAETYLEEIVAPTISDFENSPTSRRYAFLAAVTVYHTLDYMYACVNDRRNKCKNFDDTSRAFNVVDRVAHAFKHVQKGNPNKPQSQPLHVSDVISRPPAYWDVGYWDVSRWDDPVGGVTLKQNVEVDLLDALKDAVAFLRTKIV